MKQDQKYTPKYWVVHDTTTDEVFLETAHKNKGVSELLFIESLAPRLPSLTYNEIEEIVLSEDQYECILIEIKKVEL